MRSGLPNGSFVPGSAEFAAARHERAWLLLTGALALHVIDEAMTDFLGFYNPLVLQVRERLPWAPLPTFTFGIWIAGLALLVVLLVLLAPVVRSAGGLGTGLSWLFAAIMFVNGVGHLAGSVAWRQWLPGATSAPLLIAASAWLIACAHARRPGTNERRHEGHEGP